MKKILSFITCLAMLMTLSVTAFAAEPNSEAPNTVATADVTPRYISGYGGVKGVSNTVSSFSFNVDVSGNADGYGLTLKTYGSGTAIISVIDGAGNMLVLDSNYVSVTMSNQAERQWNLRGIQGGTWRVNYTIMGGPMEIHCHVYG